MQKHQPQAKEPTEARFLIDISLTVPHVLPSWLKLRQSLFGI